ASAKSASRPSRGARHAALQLSTHRLTQQRDRARRQRRVEELRAFTQRLSHADMNNFPAIGLIVTLSLLFAGCDTVPKTELNETLASETAAATEEAFVALNEDAQEAVECAAFFTRTLPDGRLEVAVNLHNLGDKPLRLKTHCVFKD